MAPLKSALFITTLTVVITTIAFLPLTATAHPKVTAHPNVTAMYAFGDSILDPGNNNFIKTAMRANHKPYGMDFPGKVATGRFSDGKLSGDIMVSSLGIKKLLPAYLDPARTKEDLFTGVSFASAGTGIDDMTARVASVMSLSKQLGHFEEALKVMGNGPEVGRALSNGFFLISGGSNDMMYGFYGSAAVRKNFSMSAYHDLLLNNLQSFIMKLTSMGARKIAVLGLPPIGCVPLELGSAPKFPARKGVCIEQKNKDCQAYNAKLQAFLPRLSSSLPSGSKLAYVDIYTLLLDMIFHPANYGFEKSMQGCCGHGYVELGLLCNSVSPVCPNPQKYLFWDAVHPTQTAYEILSDHFLKEVLPTLY